MWSPINYTLRLLSIALSITVLACNTHSPVLLKESGAVPDSVLKNIQTAPVTLQESGEVIKLNGKIIPNEKLQAKVFALVSGKIRSVAVELGDFVHRGQTLAVLQSSEVALVSNDLSVSEANLAIAKKNMESTKELYQSNLATE